ncbi:ABC transporter substrate-binding protein [Paraburkholderia lycopersici]|uniref:ABC-type nitrate/sulfonate/bicarbonate transport system, substrate-binding protein n=1 Tax=Paraburkholderia lycopersici TaxID=416944 RepID=A0A1G6HB24_9BURK|nr:ABC transporter substrate-binding protein [Paraburkholderia lycopersici]SDB91288.1 ABC-type nitrate/sulfonate/bicarbonate transport system, substrate-binding protein [Paraburkholderia lycopersici]
MADHSEEIWCIRPPVPTPLSIAWHLGWLQDAMRGMGVALRSLQEDSRDPQRFSPHVQSDLPDSLRQGGSVPALYGRSAGQASRLIGLTWTDEFQALAVLPTAGIRTPKDLRGRRIGLPKHALKVDHNRAAALRVITAVLDAEGIGRNEVEWVDLEDHALPATISDDIVRSVDTGRRGRHTFANEARALVTGQVDVIYLKDVRGAETAHLIGAQLIVNIGFHPDPMMRIGNGTPRPLTVNQRLLDRHPELVGRLLDRVVAAGEWAARNPVQAIEMIGRETGWTPSWIRYAYGNQVHRALRLELDPQSIDGIKRLKAFLHGEGFLPDDFGIDQWIDPKPLSDVMRSRPVDIGDGPIAMPRDISFQ